MNNAVAVKVRDALMKGLLGLEDGLGDFEMTCHGSGGPHGIDDVAAQLVKAWENPTAYNISELSQRILNLNRQRVQNMKGNADA